MPAARSCWCMFRPSCVEKNLRPRFPNYNKPVYQCWSLVTTCRPLTHAVFLRMTTEHYVLVTKRQKNMLCVRPLQAKPRKPVCSCYAHVTATPGTSQVGRASRSAATHGGTLHLGRAHGADVQSRYRLRRHRHRRRSRHRRLPGATHSVSL